MHKRPNPLAFIRLGFLAYILLIPSVYSESQVADAPAEKQVMFYPTYGYQSADGLWTIPFRLWVSEDMDLVRKGMLKTARKIIEQKAGIDDLTQAQKTRFYSRAEDFFRDSESGVEIEISFDFDAAKTLYPLKGFNEVLETDRNGNLVGSFKLSRQKVEALLKAENSRNGWLSFTAKSKDYFGQGRLQIISAEGVSVISDIDDTIKVTNIPKGSKAVLNNTFFNPFVSASGMPEMYQGFLQGTTFHYVSGSPWQLYRPLATFLIEDKALYPRGSFHMKNVRTNFTESETYSDFTRLFEGGATEAQKIEQISTILSHFPKRRFFLIGDSGEHDPEVFKMIRNKYPKQIQEIRIRDLVNAAEKQPDRLEGMVVIKS